VAKQHQGPRTQKRGLKNLRTSPDALPEVISDQTVAAFEKYNVLSRRELESRYEVWLEQYSMQANIEAETTSTIARTLLLPAALRHQKLVDEAGVEDLQIENRDMVQALVAAIGKLEIANQYPEGIEDDPQKLAEYARDFQLSAMAAVRKTADLLERYVADDLWPMPKYSEMLFIK